MQSHVAQKFRRPREFQIRRARIGAVRRYRHRRHFVTSIRQCKAIAERPVRSQLDPATANGHRRIRLRRAVDDQLGIDVEPEALFASARRAAKGAAHAGD